MREAAARHGGYRSYRFRSAALMTFFVCYVVVAVAGSNFATRGEFFPVFSWSLFSRVENPKVDWRVLIHRIGQERFDPPKNFYALTDRFPLARNRSTDASKTTRLFGYGIYHELDTVEETREVFEKRLFQDQPDVEYEMLLTRFDPLERWRHGTDIAVKSYGVFTTGDDRP